MTASPLESLTAVNGVAGAFSIEVAVPRSIVAGVISPPV